MQRTMLVSLRWIVLFLFFGLQRHQVIGFVIVPESATTTSGITSSKKSLPSFSSTITQQQQTVKKISYLCAQNFDDDEAKVTEELRLKIYESRRRQIRSTLKTAESLRNFRIKNGFVPELDEDGKPIKDNQLAYLLTGVAVAVGALVLRIGGRAAFVSALGLDFASENPELKEQLQFVLDYSDGMDITTKLGAFVLAWTIVKVSCFDPLGIALALSSGILFGGVLQGAVVSAGAATFGSLVAFSMSQSDLLPFRKKALELLDEYPTLRGIEKVVAEDGFKAILTLRLAPVLPIPIGMYNYIYGVTNVPVLDFMAGIFVGSLKPYLLDSYLGYFGKSIMDGSLGDGNTLQDFVLLTVLGVSVVLGVFASQVASETWESVIEEIEADQQAKEAAATGTNATAVVLDDGIKRDFLGMDLPQWVVGYQTAMQQATYRMEDLTLTETEAQVWNYTTIEKAKSLNDMEMTIMPDEINPAKASDSPEVVGKDKGIDYVQSLCDGLVMSPVLFDFFLRYSDPLFDEEKEKKDMDKKISRRNILTENSNNSGDTTTTMTLDETPAAVTTITTATAPILSKKEELLKRLDSIESRSKDRLQLLEDRLKEYDNVPNQEKNIFQ